MKKIVKKKERKKKMVKVWESPIYKFKKKIYDQNGVAKESEIIIDVTGSAPTMPDPGEYLKRVFTTLANNRNPKKIRILDVGAAKLRNTLWLLKKGFQVYAVEFPELAKRMPQAKKNWEIAEKKYPQNFKKLVFPKDFFKLKQKVDIILLINVLNVMPSPQERLVLLTLCREKMKKKGLLLWYNWRDISSNSDKYTEQNKLNDGFFKGIGRKNKTFHVEWEREYALEMLASAGFFLNKEIKLGEVGNTQAYVLNPKGLILLERTLKLPEMKKGQIKRNLQEFASEIEKIFFPKLYVEELKNILIKRGKEATKFHRVSSRLLATIFDHQLKNPVIEKEINEGRGRVDIRFKNKNNPGFLKNLKELREVRCPSIVVECKNRNEDPKNPEFAQLADRLKPNRGMFGILVCRKILNKSETIKHCKDRLEKGEWIIVLDDEDLRKLANIKLEEGDEGVDDYMENKIDEIVD